MSSQTKALYQALLKLAIAQKQAVEQDDFDKVAKLMDDRERLMAEIEFRPDPARQRSLRGVLEKDSSITDTIKLIIELDKQIENGILGRMAQVQNELLGLQQGDKIVSGYRPVSAAQVGSFQARG